MPRRPGIRTSTSATSARRIARAFRGPGSEAILNPVERPASSINATVSGSSSITRSSGGVFTRSTASYRPHGAVDYRALSDSTWIPSVSVFV